MSKLFKIMAIIIVMPIHFITCLAIILVDIMLAIILSIIKHIIAWLLELKKVICLGLKISITRSIVGSITIRRYIWGKEQRGDKA